MTEHLEKVLEHAERKLWNTSDTEPTDLLDLYRRFLKIEEHRLWLNHKAGEGGLALGQKRSNLITVVLKQLFENATEAANRSHAIEPGSVQVSLMAVGGFGREVLSPESDIDLMFLHDRFSPNSSKARYVTDIIEQILYMLWDIGLKVGHSSRDVEEAVKQGRDDYQNTTAMMDARRIAGSSALAEQFRVRFQRMCLKGRERAFIEWRMQDQQVRHAKFENTVFMQEPHVKNGCGGLRDYHHLIWVATVAKELTTTSALQKQGWLSLSERKEIDKAVDFITRVRNQLHYLTERPTDILTLSLQGDVARAFAYPQRSILRKTEALMKDYYEHSQNLFHLSNLVSQRLQGSDQKGNGFLDHLIPRGLRNEQEVDGFRIRSGVIASPSTGYFRADPKRILKVFQLGQRYGATLSPDLEMRLRKASRYLNRRMLWNAEVRDMVLDILKQKGRVGRIMRLMHQTRVLGKVIPEFQPLTCLVQHEFYHRYTADEHTLVCLEQLDQVLDHDELPYRRYRVLLEDCNQADLLYLALILHDTGKAANTQNHAAVSTQLAVKCARRFKLKGRRLNTLGFLVDHHGTLTEYACRKNLEDPQTSRDFAAIVQDAERLDLLMLLSFADGKGTGDNSWSNWKEGLVWQLYNLTRSVLKGDEAFLAHAREEQKETLERVRGKLKATVSHDEFLAHFELMPPGYLHYRQEDLIVQQIQMVHEFVRKQVEAEAIEDCLKPSVHWENRPAIGCSEITIVTWDNERAFSKICGVFNELGLMIISADIWTRRDNILIDTFRVCTERLEAASNPYDREKFNERLSDALADPDYNPIDRMPRRNRRTDVQTLDLNIIPSEFGLDNNGSQDHTLLHAKSPDRLGLLYVISNTIANHGLIIRSARITTEKGMALDTFYLQTDEGKKLEDRQRGVRLVRDLEKRVADFLKE